MAETILAGQSRVLEMVARRAPLPDILQTLVCVIEGQSKGMLASVLLLSADRKHLHLGAAPSLPDAYNQAVEGIEIGPNVGSCGTAAYLNQPVVVTDIATDPRWMNVKQLALPHGLRACWSTPIRSSLGDVLGTFAMYYREPHAPTPHDRRLIDVATHLASIALERERIEEDRAQTLEHERAARERAEHLAAEITAIVSQVAEGIIVTDANGDVTFINEAAKRIHGICDHGNGDYRSGYELFTLAGQPYPPEDRPLWRAIHEGVTTIDAEWRIRRTDGTEIIAQGSAVPVVADRGQRVAAVLTVRDVTSQRTFERQKDEFLAAASHDLKGPLTVIKGTAELLERRVIGSCPETERIIPGLARIATSTTTMTSLLDELLDIARLRMGRPLTLDRVPTDLIALVGQLAAEYQLSTERHQIRLRSELPSLWGSWDRPRLARVFGNLLSNAVKYSPAGGEIDVEVAREVRIDGAWAVAKVRDHGIGIPASEIDQIFDRFHRAENVVGRVKGSGLGLASAKFIVEQHGGEIAATSVEGVGTTMTVRLPLA